MANTPPREWVPSCFLVLHDGPAYSTVRYTPMHVMRAAEVSYHSEIRIFGRSATQPVWAAESGAMQLEDVFTIESGRIVQELGVERLFAYGEALNRSPEMAPPTANIAMPLHVRYGSADGSFRGQLASFFIFGAPRSVERGESYYESFPAALMNREFSLRVFVLNPYVRACRWRVKIIDSVRGAWTSPEMTIRAKGAAEWRSADSGYPGSPDPVGVIVQSDLKTTSFFATLDAAGKMIGLDHGHPFLAQVLQ